MSNIQVQKLIHEKYDNPYISIYIQGRFDKPELLIPALTAKQLVKDIENALELEPSEEQVKKALRKYTKFVFENQSRFLERFATGEHKSIENDSVELFYMSGSKCIFSTYVTPGKEITILTSDFFDWYRDIQEDLAHGI